MVKYSSIKLALLLVTFRVKECLNLNYCSWFIGVSMYVPENAPASAFIYMILARDPDPGQEVEVSISILSINFFQLSLFKNWSNIQ